MAFACLVIPYILSAGQLALEKESDDNPPPDGHNPHPAAEFWSVLDAAKKYGYDPTKDYRV